MTQTMAAVQTAKMPDGAIQAYRDSQGCGETIVLLHGISSGAASWQQQFASLGQNHRLIAWDAPGYGLSDGLTTTQPSAVDFATRLQALVDVLQLESFVLVGHSLGALIASAYASLQAARLQGLLLANVAQGYGRSDAEKQEQVFLKRPTLLKKLGNAGMAAERGPALVWRKSPEQIALITEVMQGLTLSGFTNASYLLAHDSILNYLPVSGLNTHIVYAEQDDITPKQDMQTLAQTIALPASHLHGINEAGHLSYLDQADAFNQVLVQLLHNNNKA